MNHSDGYLSVFQTVFLFCSNLFTRNCWSYFFIPILIHGNILQRASLSLVFAFVTVFFCLWSKSLWMPKLPSTSERISKGVVFLFNSMVISSFGSSGSNMLNLTSLKTSIVSYVYPFLSEASIMSPILYFFGYFYLPFVLNFLIF